MASLSPNNWQTTVNPHPHADQTSRGQKWPTILAAYRHFMDGTGQQWSTCWIMLVPSRPKRLRELLSHCRGPQMVGPWNQLGQLGQKLPSPADLIFFPLDSCVAALVPLTCGLHCTGCAGSAALQQFATEFATEKHTGVSENSVSLNPMVNDQNGYIGRKDEKRLCQDPAGSEWKITAPNGEDENGDGDGDGDDDGYRYHLSSSLSLCDSMISYILNIWYYMHLTSSKQKVHLAGNGASSSIAGIPCAFTRPRGQPRVFPAARRLRHIFGIEWMTLGINVSRNQGEPVAKSLSAFGILA